MKVKDYKAWFNSPLKLKEIGEKFKKLKLLTEYYYDYENVYEWLEANTLNANIKINISRAHKEGINFESENISLLIMYKKEEPKDSYIDKISELISKEFNLSVYTGEIKYLSGDNYKYIPQKLFS